MRAAVFFDRDGTLTRDHGYTHRVSDLELLAGAAEAVRAVNASGALAIMVTNQAGIARGKYNIDDMNVFNETLKTELAKHGAHLDAVYFCPYHEEGTVAKYTIGDHPDRKPNAGMLRRALLEWNVDAARSFVVGDRDSDVQAARGAGMEGVLVREGELLSAVLRELEARAALPAPLPAQSTVILRDRAARAQAWLFGVSLPLWWNKGFDHATGSFFERLNLSDAAPVHLARRIRVQARQTYVYAQAGALGWTGPWRDAVRAGCKVLMERGIRADGGTAYALDATTGAVSDSRRDLYDAAFIIFALAHGGKALQDTTITQAAEQVYAWVRTNWQLPAGGFHEGDMTPSPPHRQNPHMHMLEALLALHEATGNARYLHEDAAAIVKLFETRFVDAEYGALREYFDAQWRPAAGDEGRITEPGHQFEWSWLIGRYAAAASYEGPAVDLARRIHLHGEVYGVTPATGVVADEVWIEGRVKIASSRLWPHTERIKAHIARYERTGEAHAATLAAQAFDTLMRYCDVATPGLWRDRLQANGTFIEEAAPASSYYHIVVALSELIRVANK